MTSVKVLLFALALYGMIRFVMQRFAQSIENAISIVLVSIGIMMTAAGILNILPEAAYVLCGAGIICAIYTLKERPMIPWKGLLTAGTVFFGVWAVWGVYYNAGLVFTHYDDYSHWGRVVNCIIQNERIPNHLDTSIFFKSYPTGTACLLYFMMQFLPRSEGMLMLMQFLFTASCLLPFFNIGQKKSILGWIAISALSLYLLAGLGLQVNALLVDRVLPLVAVAGLLVFYQNRTELRKAMLLLLPYLLYLPMIKTSGMLFAVPLLAFFIYEFIKQRGFKKQLTLPAALTVVSPFLMFFLWKKHTSLVFTNPNSNKHSFSLSYFEQVIHEKTAQDVSTIVHQLVEKTLMDPLLYILLAVLVICVLLAGTKRRRYFATASGAIVAFYVVYQLGLLLMYLFSMPTGEALTLAEYTRYYLSISLFMVSMVLLVLVETINHFSFISSTNAQGISKFSWPKIMVIVTVVGFVAAVLGATESFSIKQYIRPEQSNTKRVVLDELMVQNGLEAHRAYLLVDNSTEDDGGYAFFLFGFLTNPRSEIEIPYTINRLENYRNYSGGIIVLDANEEQWTYIEEVIRTDPSFADRIYGHPTLYSGIR